MAEGLFAFLVFAGISIYCWALVLRPRFRQRILKPGWLFRRWTKQERADVDAVTLAFSLAGALLFSIITIVAVVAAVYHLFSD